MDYPSLLRQHGLRATPGRIALLECLAREPHPASVDSIQKKLELLDLATLYRALETLCDAGIVVRTDLQQRQAHYELAVGRPHHHHAICRTCGLIEDIATEHSPTLERDALKHSQRFALIDRHALEFFGTCKACT